MAAYFYNLLTRTKKVRTQTGAKVEMNVLKFGYKDCWDGAPRKQKLLEARLENLWAVRDAPKYVVNDFGDGTNYSGTGDNYPVYVMWTKGVVTVSDAGDDRRVIGGYLRGVGKDQYFEEWFVAPVVQLSIRLSMQEQQQARTAAIETLREAGMEDFYLVQREIQYTDRTDRFLFISCKREADVLIAKMAL